MRALELFAGIGGLGLATPPGWRVVAAYDQDAAARATLEANGIGPAIAIDLAHVTPGELARHDASAWLASPPCQPFTRRGRGRDVDDPRCAGLLRMIELVPVLRPRRVLVENVVGFAGSRAHAALVAALRGAGHEVATVQACPSEMGWPVRRPRELVVASVDGLVDAPARRALASAPPTFEACLDAEPGAELALDASRSPGWAATTLPLATFTRSYGRSTSGAGPLLVRGGAVRRFSPEEILRLHGFPAAFAFPPALDLRTRWRLAGNSVHVPCVAAVMARLG